MRKFLIYLSVALLTIVFCGNITAQKYSKVKVTMKNGVILEGKKGFLSHDNIKFSVDGVLKDYALQEVNLVMAKKNRTGAYAGAFAGGCFAICLVAIIANPDDADVGQLFVGSLIWTGIFAGIGAGVGALASKWKVVYVNTQHTSVLDRLDLSFTSYRDAPYNVGVVCKL